MNNIEVFDKYAQEYDKWFDANRFVYESEVLALKEFIPATNDGLEVGVGTGRFAVALGIKVGVERESVDTDILNVTAQVCSSMDTGGKKFAFGVCLKVRQFEGSKICSLATMQDFYEKVRECYKAITFRRRSLSNLTSFRSYNSWSKQPDLRPCL